MAPRRRSYRPVPPVPAAESEGLWAYVALRYAIARRDADSTRHLLRYAAMHLEESEGHKVGYRLVRTLESASVRWLQSLA